MMRKVVMSVLLLGFLAFGLFTVVNYYSYIFAKSVVGVVIGVERVNDTTAIIGSARDIPANQMFSYAVAIRQKSGEIFTASSEDRQWAVVQKGNCTESKFYPYPPWNLEKAGTYFNARLIRLFDCPSDMKM